MRGPLFSGPIGHAATLSRLLDLARAAEPVSVFSSVWLAAALSEHIPVLLLVEPDQRSAARKAVQKAGVAGRRLTVVVAGEQVPIADGSMGTVVVEGLTEVEPPDLPRFLRGLARTLAPQGRVLALDNARDGESESRVAGAFLAEGFRGIAQERPREGAVITLGHAPLPGVLQARQAIPDSQG